ncbi:DUF2778 domain-containing protein [Paraburkholderia sp. UYCP14C]|uniref:DUF2778 domain-containing protein n=1 Tax=Paraburkholderia sp. UYCP14C TaxID=2511130 RepID=UPI0010201DEC|nr:DUF2778 domain-containing protein [Paraburkholderia sp. UYCP14C]RZF31785.1 DUF2778 domain-containing protein [Paraburkholderia sp. UYCP14C]
MALHGRFVVDNKPLLFLVVPGVGSFPAFSGDDVCRNRSGCTAVVGKGPLPAGKYWMVDRPGGGFRSKAEAFVKVTWNSATGVATDHSEWFGLYRDDSLIDDWTWVNGVKRGNFRLHPSGGGGHSFGCMTLHSRADFHRLRRTLLQTATVSAGNSGIRAYGWIEVIANGKLCP